MSEPVQRIVRGLASGTDPSRLLHDCLAAAVAGGKARSGLLCGVVDGAPVPLASSGALAPVVEQAAAAAIESGHLSRRSDRASGAHAVAQPVRVGGRTVGALALGGTLDGLDPGDLPLYSDLAALIMGQKPLESGASAAEALRAGACVAAGGAADKVLGVAFDEMERLFGITAGFCALTEPGARRVVIAYERGMDRDRLREAGVQPAFRSLIEAPAAKVEPPSHPVVARLGAGAECAVTIPLRFGRERLGQLVVLAGTAPGPATVATLDAFAGQIAIGLRTAIVREQMLDRDEQLAAVVHAAPDAVLVADDLGRFVMMNAAAAELFHLAGSFEAGQTVAGRLGHPGLEDALTGAGDGISPTEVHLASGGSTRTYRATVRAVHRAGGRLRGRVLVLQDVSATRAAEQAKADFVAVIGHELRTPITVIKGYLSALAKRDSVTPERLSAALAALSSNADRLGRLVEDLLLVSSLETSRARVELDEVDLGEVVDAHAGERVHVKRPRRAVSLEVDAVKLETVLRHLVDNALKYSDGQVSLVATVDADHVRMAVTDEGPGMYSGDTDRVFELFTQLDGSSTRAQGGTGTGLYICRRLVQAMGGTITCDSRLGQGTTMTVELPLAGPEPDAAFEEVTFART